MKKKRYSLMKRYINEVGDIGIWFTVLDYATKELLRDHIEIIVKEINSYSDSEIKVKGDVIQMFLDGELVEEYKRIKHEQQ